MNNRHRRVARLKAKEHARVIQKVRMFAETACISAKDVVTNISETISAAINLAGEAFEFYGKGITQFGKNLQGKETATLMNDLTTDEWIALARYIRGDLYIGGANEDRDEKIESFKSAEAKIIRIGEVLEGDQ